MGWIINAQSVFHWNTHTSNTHTHAHHTRDTHTHKHARIHTQTLECIWKQKKQDTTHTHIPYTHCHLKKSEQQGKFHGEDRQNEMFSCEVESHTLSSAIRLRFLCTSHHKEMPLLKTYCIVHMHMYCAYAYNMFIQYTVYYAYVCTVCVHVSHC